MMRPQVSQSDSYPGVHRRSGGFTLVELMVGIVVGMLAIVVIANVLVNAENSRRSSTSGSDAQVNGGLALFAMQRELKMAGYGLSTEGAALGCTLTARYDTSNMPATLAPVLITAGVNGASDSLRLLASSKATFSLPTRLIAPFYNPNDTSSDKATRFAVASALGVDNGDLMALVYAVNGNCQVFQVTAVPTTAQVPRADSGNWNANKFPDAAAADGAFLVNLGTLSDVSFSLTNDFRLRQTVLSHLSQSATTQDLQSNIVALRALYGKDTNGDGAVDTFDAATPTTNAGWLQVRAVRVAVLARSAQYEKDEVTASEIAWDLGSAATVPSSVAGSAACGTSTCITLLSNAHPPSSDWKHYRYKIFEMLVPLRNQVWRSDA